MGFRSVKEINATVLSWEASDTKLTPIGNGKHDDTNALNMAFSVAASEGLAVYIPAGTYLVCSFLSRCSKVWLEGYSSSRVHLRI